MPTLNMDVNQFVSNKWTSKVTISGIVGISSGSIKFSHSIVYIGFKIKGTYWQ
jgi:hypothetical protein